MKIWPLLGMLILFFSGCAFQKVYTIPPWVFQPEDSKEYIYAVGSAGKSLSAWESKELAVQDALVKLAQYASTKVFSNSMEKVYMGHQVGGKSIIQTSTDTALKEATIVEFWADPQGKAGFGYRVFVLMRLAKKYIEDIK